jgi:hypothetical protein
MKNNDTRNLIFGVATIAALGYAATKVPWGRVRSALVDAEEEFGDAFRGTIDRLACAVHDAKEHRSGRSNSNLQS